MKFNVQIKVMPHKGLLDPQGKATNEALHKLSFNSIQNLRIGKHMDMEIEADSAEQATAIATEAAEKILSNPVMEYFEVKLQ